MGKLVRKREDPPIEHVESDQPDDREYVIVQGEASHLLRADAMRVLGSLKDQNAKLLNSPPPLPERLSAVSPFELLSKANS